MAIISFAEPFPWAVLFTAFCSGVDQIEDQSCTASDSIAEQLQKPNQIT